jgi:hypothetical protein
MKKLIIGAVVGGIIIFLWQSLSWTALNLHQRANQYTASQDTILNYLSSHFSEDGEYFLPTYEPNATSEEMSRHMEAAAGKPWAKIAYHKALNVNMMGNMVRLLLVNILMVGLVIWLLQKINTPAFSTIILSCLAIGIIGFINVPYTYHIWYESRDVNAYLMDAVASWGLCGLWLGWWVRRK